MIKVKKNLSDIPKSLIKGSTLSKRNGVLAKKKFPKISEYEKRYKQKDIREKLSIIYKNKCAFCEQKITQCQNNELEECSSTVTTAKIYNRIEKPKMINPEEESVIDKLTFHNGKIDSTNERVKYTIEACGLDREALNEKRKAIIDDFIKKINAKIATSEGNSDILKNLFTDIKTKEKEFIALRIWILQNRANMLELG